MISELEGLEYPVRQPYSNRQGHMAGFQDLQPSQAEAPTVLAVSPSGKTEFYPDELYPFVGQTCLPFKHVPSCLNLLYYIPPQRRILPRSLSPVLPYLLYPESSWRLGKVIGPPSGESPTVLVEQSSESIGTNTQAMWLFSSGSIPNSSKMWSL